MKRRNVLTCLATGLALGCASSALADDAALRLATAVANRPAGRDITTIGRLELVEKSRAPRIRELVTYRRDTGMGEKASHIRFLGPADIAGTGLLSVSRADGEQEQSLYLPALDRVRRIASDRKGGRFVGSDIYYEDLQERRPVEDRHRLAGKETLNGVSCDVLESIPIDPDDSVYKKRVSWIDAQTLLPHRVDYFEHDAAVPSKRWELLAHKRIQGYWTITDSRVTDLNTGHSTRLTVEKAVYDRRLPARLFTPQALADEAIESEYRP